MNGVYVFYGKEQHCRIVAAFLNKHVVICRDFGAVVSKCDKDEMASSGGFKVILPEDVKQYSVTLEKTRTCASDFHEGFLEGVRSCNVITKKK